MVLYLVLFWLLITGTVAIISMVVIRSYYPVSRIFNVILTMYIVRVIVIVSLFALMFFSPLSFWVE